MKKIIIRDKTKIPPFNEPAREFRVLNKPLWLYQRDVLAKYCTMEIEVDSFDEITVDDGEVLVYRNNLFFDEPFIDAFITAARASGRARQVAFALDDKAIVTHALPLQDGIRKKGDVFLFSAKVNLQSDLEEGRLSNDFRQEFQNQGISLSNNVAITPREEGSQWWIRDIEKERTYIVTRVGEALNIYGDIYVADLWYLPHGIKEKPEPLVIDTEPQEKGFYHIPTYMAEDIRHGDVVYYVPLKAFLSIENWVHVLTANSPFGIFAIGARMEKEADKFSFQIRAFVRALLEHKQFLSSSAVVQVGKNTQIDPTAIIQGPSFIGDNVTIGAGAVIVACIIGNNVNVMQGSQLCLSVVSDGCYIPFRAGLFMSALMENSMVAQNACLQLCLVGRDSFVGAGVTFTDFNVIPKPLRTMHKGELQPIGRTVWGGCVGHHCRIGADLTIYPCRTIESDTVLIRSDKRAVITKNVSYEESDHHHLRDQHLHHRLYPRGQ